MFYINTHTQLRLLYYTFLLQTFAHFYFLKFVYSFTHQVKYIVKKPQVLANKCDPDSLYLH